jgi:hypothetical protein
LDATCFFLNFSNSSSSSDRLGFVFFFNTYKAFLAEIYFFLNVSNSSSSSDNLDFVFFFNISIAFLAAFYFFLNVSNSSSSSDSFGFYFCYYADVSNDEFSSSIYAVLLVNFLKLAKCFYKLEI